MAMSRTGKIVLIIISLLLALVLVAVIGLAILFSSLNSEPEIHDNSVLVLKVEGALQDYTNDDTLAGRFFGGDPNSLTNLLAQLRKAKIDKRVSAVLLDIDIVGAGWAKADEIRDAVADFRASGKPLYAYMEYGSDKEYYIATAAERVYVGPSGDLFINGLAAEAMFFRGSFDKLGIEWDSYQIGKYKNSPERFTRKDMSEGERETINALLDDIFNHYVGAVAESRHKTPEEVRAWIDNAPHHAPDALKGGLIDGALYREDVEAELKKRLGYKDDEKLHRVTTSDYRQVSEDSLGLNDGERIAVVYAAGAIGSGKSSDGSFGGEQSVGSDTVVKALNDARDDKTIKAIVLRVDSPGGSTYPSDVIWKAVEEAKKKKPVVVSMSDLAASGGYYISTGANKIIAEPTTLTGSIGVYAYKPVMKGFYDWIGVTAEYTLRGQNAGMFRETEKFTDSERAKFHSMLDHFYHDEFVPKVAAGRHRDPEYINSIAQGRVWTGMRAKENGLVDEFGGMERAVAVARELANLPADKDVRRVVFPAPRTFFERIFGEDEEDNARARARAQHEALLNSLPESVRRTMRVAIMFNHFKEEEQLAILPFDLEIK